MGVSTGELVRRLRETLPPYQQKRLTHLVDARARAARRTSSTGRCAPRRCARSSARTSIPRRVFVGRERRRLDPRPRHLSLDRPARSWPGTGALAYQGITLSLANYDRLDHPREDLRHPAVVDLHPRVDRAAHQRGQARAALRALRRARPAPRPAAAPGLRAAASAARRSASGHNQFVRLDTLQSRGRLSDLGRHRGLDPRLRAGPRAAS